MPDVTALGKLFRKWESLIGACENNSGLVPGAEPMKDELKAFLAQARALKVEQEHLTGRRKAVTQLLRVTQNEAGDIVLRIQGLVLKCLGPRAEQLTEFGMNPIRSRKRKVKPPEPTPPPETSANPAAPQASTGAPASEGTAAAPPPEGATTNPSGAAG
jgi:hypothetical protein